MFYQTVPLSMFLSDLLKASRVTATVIICWGPSRKLSTSVVLWLGWGREPNRVMILWLYFNNKIYSEQFCVPSHRVLLLLLHHTHHHTYTHTNVHTTDN